MDVRRHRWLFRVEDDDGVEHGLDSEGWSVHAEEFYLGTDAEAEVEGTRRADLWEMRPENGMVVRVTREGHGVL